MTAKRYWASPEATAALAHDGIGWGHDFDGGYYHYDRQPRPPSTLARLASRLKGRH